MEKNDIRKVRMQVVKKGMCGLEDLDGAFLSGVMHGEITPPIVADNGYILKQGMANGLLLVVINDVGYRSTGLGEINVVGGNNPGYIADIWVKESDLNDENFKMNKLEEALVVSNFYPE